MKKTARITSILAAQHIKENTMNTKIIRIHAPRRNPRHPVRYSQQALDALTLRALAELVVDVMEGRTKEARHDHS